MPGLPSQPIIIVRKKKGHGGGHHGGSWKVAYADFVTAMMALFIVLWLLSASDQVQKAVGGYFTDPQGKGKDVGNGLKGSGTESLSVNKDDMNKLKEKLEQAVKSSEAQKIRDHVIFTVTGEGLRVELLEGENSTFFESGNAQPTAFGKELLGKLAEEIGKLPNKVTMEGHTDSRPFTQRTDYSNWELSSDRANAARRWMQLNGMGSDQVTQVRGFADQSLRNPADPNDASNRRVTLIIQYQRGAAGPGGAAAEGKEDQGAKAEAGNAKPEPAAPNAGAQTAATPKAAQPEPARPPPPEPARVISPAARAGVTTLINPVLKSDRATPGTATAVIEAPPDGKAAPAVPQARPSPLPPATQPPKK
jgi:chemotaxis protein MotB